MAEHSPHSHQLSLSGIEELMCSAGQGEGDFHGSLLAVCGLGLLRGPCIAACPGALAGPSLLPALPQHHSEGAEVGERKWPPQGEHGSPVLRLGRIAVCGTSEVKNAQEERKK